MINIYCDESCHLPYDQSDVMVLEALSCQESEKQRISQDIRAIKSKYGINQNDESPNLKVWESINSKTKEKSFCIRYESQEEGIDYIIIFAKKGGKNGKDILYTLKTAFPISLKSFKKRFNKEYDKYIEKRAK